MSQEKHIFSKRPSNRNLTEFVLTAMLKLATYVVIISAGFIFLNIVLNGSKAVFKSEAPFINIDFLIQKPQTLHVYEPRDFYDQIKVLNSERIQLEKEYANLGTQQKEKHG